MIILLSNSMLSSMELRLQQYDSGFAEANCVQQKNGRDWLIPALVDKPKRGFESVSYNWDLLPLDIIETFPFLEGCNNIYIYRDEADKKAFYCITGWPSSQDRKKIVLTAKDRERLELALIGTPSVMVDEIKAGVMFVPSKRSSSLPVLQAQHDVSEKNVLPSSDIVVRQHNKNSILFSLDSEVGSSFEDEYPAPYLHPIYWEFWGVPCERENIAYEFIDNDDFDGCVKFGVLTGYLLLCNQMIMDGYNPYTVCDDESTDLECVMSVLSGGGGPLNDLTGEPMQDVFYIHELIIEESLRRQRLGTRLLQELPYPCKRLLHIAPDILAYYVVQPDEDEHANKNASDHLSDQKHCEDLPFFDFYKSNEFQELGNSRLLYTFTGI